MTTKIEGEKESVVTKKSLALAVERYNADDMGNKTISLDGSEVILPANFTACLNKSSVNRMVCFTNSILSIVSLTLSLMRTLSYLVMSSRLALADTQKKGGTLWSIAQFRTSKENECKP